LVQMANSQLHLSEYQLHAEAELIFQAVGKTLKRRREIDDHDVLESYLTENQVVDPAKENPELESRLQTQAEEGKRNMATYLDNFYRDNVLKEKNGGENLEEDGGENDEEEVEELMGREADEIEESDEEGNIEDL